MLQQATSLDLAFQALADPVRRAMVERLSRGPATVSDLARPLAMSLSAIGQHLRVLEASGLVRSEKTGRLRTCWIDPAGLLVAGRWIIARQASVARDLERLGEHLAAPPTQERPMTQRSITHATFVLERSYDATPARAFAAWADPKAKARWFPAAAEPGYEFDFREGGREYSASTMEGGTHVVFAVDYREIVPDQRIVYTYYMDMDGARISVSVATIEFHAQGSGVRMVVTEMGAFLDGHDTPAQREHGTAWMLDQLGGVLNGAVATA